MKLIFAILMMAFVFTSLGGSSTPFTATAYCLRGKTASGHKVSQGVVAADKKVLSMGTKIILRGGRYSGLYTVRDTGSKIKGKRLDIWLASCAEAKKFGRQKVYVTIL